MILNSGRDFLFGLVCGLAVLALSGCMTKPTKSFEQQPLIKKDLSSLPADVVLIDARPSFQYQLAHPSGAIGMSWQDFSQKSEPFLGVLEKDLFFHSRRLARMGIGPESSVVVLGNGQQGQGEEGRIAWTLKVLGIKKVQIAHIDHFRMANSQSEPPPRAALPIWKPESPEAWEIGKAEFENLVFKPRVAADSPVLIDVRTVDEYLGRAGRPLKMDYAAINIPWTEFITSQGEPDPAVIDHLQSLGIGKSRRVILVDWRGVRSGLATFVLREFGFKASNYSGGYDELEKLGP